MGYDVFEILKNPANKAIVVVKDVINWASTTIEDIRNDELSWGEKGHLIVEAGRDTPEENPSIAVMIDFAQTPTSSVIIDDAATQDSDAQQSVPPIPKQQEAPTDITLNLQYFFPYCDQVFLDNHNVRVVFIVICPTGADEQRVKCYLSAMCLEKPRLCICTAVAENPNSVHDLPLNVIQPATISYGALLPLFCVGGNAQVNPDYDPSDKREAFSSARLGTYSDVFFNYIVNGQTFVSIYSQLSQFLKAGYSAIDAINSYFTSDSAGPAKPKKLEKNRSNLWNTVHGDPNKSRIKRLPLITQAIWLHSIRFTLYQGAQWNKYDISSFTARLELLLWDSIAYGEGILQLLENSELHSQHHCGYLSIYFHRVALNRISQISTAVERRVRVYHKYRFNRRDSFETLSENVYLEFNIIDMGRDGNYQAQGIPVTSGKSLTELFYGETTNATPEKAAYHYGLPLFFRTVIFKKGRFICTSPKSDNTTFQLIGRNEPENGAQVQETEQCIQQAWTGYQILLPLALNSPPQIIASECTELFDSSYLRDQVKPSQYSCKIISSEKFIMEVKGGCTAEQKIELSNAVCVELDKIISDASPQDSYCVYVMKIMELTSLQLELCLKGIFLMIANRKSKKQLLLRLVFSDEYAISEAVRRFSIFYDRSGENKWMAHTQVAFCDASEGCCPVRLVLAGSNIASAYITAKQYMHYNINMDSGYLCSQIEYLTLHYTFQRKTKPLSQPLFPFDLVKFDLTEGAHIPHRSDFERKITALLDTEFQSEGYGCKISNAHVRLGSKLHIRDFYDAELLFQSTANTYRFAYLLAEKIIDAIPKETASCNTLYLIGYENYASILVEEVNRLLKSVWERSRDVIHLQYIKIGESAEQIITVNSPNPDDSLEQEFNKNQGSKRTVIPHAVIIMPIGTTLSTVYKIKNAFTRTYPVEIPHKSFHNYALIVVGHDKTLDSSVPADPSDPRVFPDSFWDMGPPDSNTIILTPEKAPAAEPTTVQWMFMPKTQWLRPDHCALCGTNHISQFLENTPALLQHIPLCQVDKTSTIPALIFPAQSAGLNHGISFANDPCSNTNNYRLENMRRCIEYGHIQRGANHYQFYIDYQKYYRIVQDKCVEWLKTQREKIDQNGFNIIVSPLQPDNCLFVKDVLDHLFLHSLRFLYIPLHDTYREEIRARFSYMAKEYRDACSGAIAPKYNIYYVDYSIVSGQSLRRAEGFIRMLLSDADSSAQINIFEKVILLTNRSSRDTAATIVRNPEHDFLSFSTLCIPSYNTLSNHCPACELVESYQTIAKCSATNELFQHFHYLEQKHRLRSLEEHRAELKRMHFSRQTYLINYFQSLIHQLDRSFLTKLSKDEDFRIILNEITRVFQATFSRLYNSGDLLPLLEHNELTLYRIMEESIANAGADTRKDVRNDIERYYKALIDGRNWRRLICTHQAVALLEKLECQSTDQTEQNAWDPAEIRKQIWNIITARLSTVQSQNSSPADIRFEKREWLISYIKVFSREYPAKIAPARSAIYTLLELLFMELVTQEFNSAELWKQALSEEFNYTKSGVCDLLQITDKCDSSEVLQLYQLYITLGKRLSDLQSNILLQYPVLQAVDQFLGKLLAQVKKHDANTECDILAVQSQDLWDKNHLQADYLHMIKWTAMSSSEESKAFLLQSLSEALSKTAETSNSTLISSSLGEVIRQENTRILYSGIKRLNQIFGNTEATWYNYLIAAEDALRESGWNSPADSTGSCTEPISLYMQNPLYDLIKFMRTDVSSESLDGQRQSIKELLAALLGFYRSMQLLESKSEREAAKDYNKIYLDLCFYLGKLGDFKNCCLVHRSNDEYTILSQRITEDFDDVFETVRTILTICENKSELKDGKLYNTVYQYEPADGLVSSLILALRIKRDTDVTYWQKVFFVLFEKRAASSSPKKRDARRHYLLFMRQQLQSFLERDLYALHHFKLSREDVSPINSSDEINILHLTDLHISTENESDILNLIKSNADELRAGNPELMVVTGDVVQGNGSAVDLEENYKSAVSVLTAIAQTLWTNTDAIDGREMMNFDWKKRIIIIPGNHDYSSMNELIASSSMRSTTIGVPMNRNGSPMSKYAYYIQFLQDFLEIDSSQSIRDNLNSIIEYPSFNLRFIALNSVAEVGPLRNNKVQLDSEFIDRVASHKHDDFTNIYLAHHTCCYQPDYFQDRYWVKGLEPPVVQFAKDILQTCLEGSRAFSANRKEEIAATEEKLRQLIDTKVIEYRCLTKTLSHSRLTKDILYILEHWKEPTNERCMHILSDYELNQSMAETDMRTYHQRIQKLLGAYHMAIMLGGHTHAAAWTRDISSPVCVNELIDEKDPNMKNICIEGARFYSSNEQTILRYGKLTISGKGIARTLKYTFYPSCSIYKKNVILTNVDETTVTAQ